MIKHVWSIVCSDSILDKDSNNITLVKVLERLVIGTSKFPVTVPLPMQIVSTWVRENLDEPAEGYVRVRNIPPDGVEIVDPIEYKVDLTNTYRHRQVVKIGAFAVKAPGVMRIVVEIRLQPVGQWQAVAEVPIEIAEGKKD